MTEYVILRKLQEENGRNAWLEVGIEEASGTKTAIRAYANDTDTDGRFVAVPARSWKPVDAAIETKKQLRLT